MDTTPTIDTSSVIELRQYTLKPGRRDELIELFDSRFIESQEACGMRVLGQFRDRGRPDHFVWLRGFDDMPSRAKALEAFYGGEVWKANRQLANDTMIDSDDVLLLRPVTPASGVPQVARPSGMGGSQPASSRVLGTIYLLTNPVDDDFRAFFDTRVMPLLAAAGAAPQARFETEYAANNFPRLPVRAGEHAYVWFTAFADDAALREYQAKLADSTQWREVCERLRGYLSSPAHELVLEPTARSRFRHVAPFVFPLDRTGSRSDFDFIAGGWRVRNRRLRVRGAGGSEWETFDATHHGRLYLDGIANVDEMTFPEPVGQGMTVRSFDRARRQWSIYWVSGRDGVMTPPVVGGFDGRRGEFFGEDHDGARRVKVRFIWTLHDAAHARWEQAFSYDDATWETNWIMDFTLDGAPS